jgi:hypothetical protein
MYSARLHNLVVMGEREMTDFVWWWSEGDIKIFTKNIEVAEKAMKGGMLVMGRKARPNPVEC